MWFQLSDWFWVADIFDALSPLNSAPFFRPQNIELGATGGASKQDSSNMAEMTVEEMTMRANQVTDEVHYTEFSSLDIMYMILYLKKNF